MKTAIYLLLLLCCLPIFGQTSYYNFQDEIFDEIGFREKLQSIEKIYGEQGGFKYTKANYKVLSMKVRQDSIIQNVDVILSQSNSSPLDINTGLGDLIGQPFPDFELQNLALTLKSKADYSDKITLVNLWFTSCPPCIAEIPYLNHLTEAYKDRVHFVAITFNTKDTVTAFLKRKPFYFEHLVDAARYLKDDLQNNAYPRLVILDRQGKVRFIENAVMSAGGSNTPNSVVEILKEHLDFLLTE
jgi:thiol-disulfide isomerase/thioredoxin